MAARLPGVDSEIAECESRTEIHEADGELDRIAVTAKLVLEARSSSPVLSVGVPVERDPGPSIRHVACTEGLKALLAR